MTMLQISLSDDLDARLKARAAEAGYSSVEAYAKDLLQADTGADPGAPEHLHFDSDEELEEMLLKRLDDDQGSVEVTPQYWADLRKQLTARRPSEPRP